MPGVLLIRAPGMHNSQSALLESVSPETDTETPPSSREKSAYFSLMKFNLQRL